MTKIRETMIKQIEALLVRFKEVEQSWFETSTGGEFTEPAKYEALITETWAIINHIYDENSVDAQRVVNLIDEKTLDSLQGIQGVLVGIRHNYKNGLMESYETGIIRNVEAGYLASAQALNEEGYTQAAALIGAMVYEDAMKRVANKNNIRTKKMNMGEVNDALKEAGVIEKMAHFTNRSFIKTRNSAIHAEWKDITQDSVELFLSFVSTFLEKYEV